MDEIDLNHLDGTPHPACGAHNVDLWPGLCSRGVVQLASLAARGDCFNTHPLSVLMYDLYTAVVGVSGDVLSFRCQACVAAVLHQ